MLRNPEVLHRSISLIVQAFSDVVAMEALRVRWEEIKRLQLRAIGNVSNFNTQV